MKFISVFIVVVILTVGFIVGYNVTHETIDAGYVGYVYDRNATAEDNVIEGTSVINEERTGRIKINPITQDVLKYPTTIIAKNWTVEDNEWNDMSMQIASSEGKNIDADIYISVRPIDIGKIIKSFGTKDFDDIVDNDIYGLTKGKLSSVSQAYSVYDMQSSRTEIQTQVFEILSETLMDVYGVELVRFEIGTLNLPAEIQAEIDKKTQAQNEVELAKLEREKQDEINQQLVDEQKAQSEKEMLQRQADADAAAYEKQKEAELEKQKSYTEEYFRDKELDVQKEAVKAINSSVKTIITSGEGEGYSGLAGIKEVLDSLNS